MAARFPQSGSSVGYQIKAAYASKISFIAWAASADSVHYLRPGDTSTTILTRATSSAGFNAAEGLITGNNNTQFEYQVSGGLGSESSDLTYIASYYGDLYNGVADMWAIGAANPPDNFANRMSMKVYTSYNWTFVAPGIGGSNNSVGGSDNVAGWMVLGWRHAPSDPIARYRGWGNGAEITSLQITSTPPSPITIGDSSNPLRFGGTAVGTGDTAAQGECWIVGLDLSDADMDAITADPSIIIEATASGPNANLAVTGASGTLSAAASNPASASLAAASANGVLNASATALASIISEPLKDNAGNLLVSTALDYVAVYDDTTGVLVVRITGLSTDVSGVFTVSHASLVAGTTYRLDWQTSTGKRRMPRKAAT